METGRNDPCPCGSGKKYKKCCLSKDVWGPMAAARPLRDLQEPLELRMAEFARGLHGEGCLEDAWEEFAREDPTIEFGGPEVQLFLPWFFYDRHPPGGRVSPKGPPLTPTIAEAFLADHRSELHEDERTFLEAVLRAPFSFHDVLESRPGCGLTLRDILLGSEHKVVEKSGSRTLERGDILFAKIVDFAGVSLMVGSGAVPIPPMEKGLVLDLRKGARSASLDLSAEVLKHLFTELKGAYFLIRERVLNPPPLVLQNTDGEPLLYHTLRYEIESPRSAFEALRTLDVAGVEEDPPREARFGEEGQLLAVEFPWTKRGNKQLKEWENTILGRIKISNRKMTVSVNSARRARKVQAEIEKRLAGTARLLATEIGSPEQAMMHQESKGGEAARIERETEELNARPEIQAAMKEMMERHWESWLTTKIPALGGKTPIQAVADPEGREMVEALLMQSEQHDRRAGRMRVPYDYDKLRSRLRLPVGQPHDPSSS